MIIKDRYTVIEVDIKKNVKTPMEHFSEISVLATMVEGKKKI